IFKKQRLWDENTFKSTARIRPLSVSSKKFCPCTWDVKVQGGNEMNMVSSVRHAFVQQKKQPISLREGQIIQGKITNIYPNNRETIQIGNHKLIAEITTSLSVRKQYFFQIQKADNVQLRVLREQHATNKITNMDVAIIIQQLGLKTNKVNQTIIRQLIQDKIPFNKEQIHQAVSLLSKAGDKSEAIELIKNMITLKLPITDATFKALQV